MATTLIEVADTAVKIGLGGLITLVGTFFIAKLNHKHEYKKDRQKRFHDALELVSEQIEEMTHVSLRYWAFVTEWVRNNQKDLGLTDKRQQELDKTKIELFDQFKNLTVAESKLLLLGLKVPSQLLRDYGVFLKEMRRDYYDGKKSITEKQMEEVRTTLLAKRESLFQSLSSSYKNDL
ncbi:hypothetical protein [Psychromonas sp. L1A2]|uniref:hypothetical protein n=1 Tax=Psychromonas sp. L1A2 TaxID=2686356 RepID=UPI0019155119|nr:hypothetical protein [Psychromonas sp. L1A2]